MENNERELCADDGIANEEKDLEVQDKQPSTTNDRIDRRDSNIELLRIVSMLMIIAHHLVYHGNIMEHVSGNTLSLILNGIFLPGGKIAYDCFIFISAWFIVQKPFSGNRYLKIALEVIFYNIVGMALATLLNGGMIEPITWRNWLGCFLPIFGISHGFAVYYLIFLIILPILQKMTGGGGCLKVKSDNACDPFHDDGFWLKDRKLCYRLRRLCRSDIGPFRFCDHIFNVGIFTKMADQFLSKKVFGRDGLCRNLGLYRNRRHFILPISG